MRCLALFTLLTACKIPALDTGDTDPTDSGDTDVTLTDDWCGVREVIAASCASCHTAAKTAGSLDLVTDPYAAIVGVNAVIDPSLVLVVPGDPASSFLYRKIADDLKAGEGDPMPTTYRLSSTEVEVVRAWIAAGASPECSDTDIVVPGTYHPDGWDEPTSHGMSMKTHDTAGGRTGVDADCRSCHGPQLDGGTSGVSCDGCHEGASEAAWRTDCTFCHGGKETDGGAPPEDIDDQSAVSTLAFIAHTSHVTQPDSDTHRPYDCATCHEAPSAYENVLAAGHIFDDTTDAEAEVDLSASLSARGVWDGTATCSNLYCHGNGQGDNGKIKHDAATPTCGGCHAWQGSSESAFNRMSGEHHKHVWDERIACDVCHAATIAGDAIVDVDQHLDGEVDVAIGPAGAPVTWNGTSCSGTCHGEAHAAERW